MSETGKMSFCQALGSKSSSKSERADTLSREVFSINFLRHEVLPAGRRRLLSRIALGYLGVQVVLLAGFLLLGVFFGVSQNSLRRQEAELLGSRAQVQKFQMDMKTLQQSAAETSTLLRRAVDFEKKRFRTVDKLGALARTLAARAWIVSVQVGCAERKLKAKARFLIDPKEPYALPSKDWIEALKKDPVFSEGLVRIEPTSSAQFFLGDKEIYEFEIQAAW